MLVSTVEEILRYIKYSHCEYSQWYAGISNNPKKSFFDIHKTKMSDGQWILCEECNLETALSIRDMLNSVGCMKNRNLDLINEEELKTNVYLYQITEETFQS